MRFYLLFIGTLVLSLSSALRAADNQSTEARLRDALKGAVQQLRAVQDQLATAQAAQAESDKQLALSKDQISQLEADLKSLKEKSETDHQASVAAIAQLNEEKAFLQRVVEDRERKNYELFKTGNEVLTRYEKFGLGEAIAAKEPFVGLTRVKLENQVQDYEDKFANSKTYAGQPISPTPEEDRAKNKQVEKNGEVKTQQTEKEDQALPSAVSPTPPPKVASSHPVDSTSAAKLAPDKDKVLQKP